MQQSETSNGEVRGIRCGTSGLASVHSPDPATKSMTLQASHLVQLQLPLPWEVFGFPAQWIGRSVRLTTGDPAWTWSSEPPAFDIPLVEESSTATTEVEGWAVDHVVLLVPDLTEAVTTFAQLDLVPRLAIKVKGRPAAFFRAGPVIEVIESPVRGPSLYGLTLVADEHLEAIALRWRARGLNVSSVRPAIQPGRRIFTVRDTEAGFAVMSPDRAH